MNMGLANELKSANKPSISTVSTSGIQHREMLSDMLGDFFKAFDGIGLFSCAIKVLPSSEMDLWEFHSFEKMEQCADGTMQRWNNALAQPHLGFGSP